MALALIVVMPVVVLVGRWAWRYQHQILEVAGTGVAHVAGKAGTVTDVQLTSVLADGGEVLVAFRPAGTKPTSRVSSPSPDRGYGAVSRHRLSILLSLNGDHQADLVQLQRWEASGAALMMWRDRNGARVELSHLRSGHQVSLAVIEQPVALTTTGS